MEKIECSKCRSRAVKNGFQSDKQCYKCTFCNKRFHLEYTYKFIISIRLVRRELQHEQKTI